MPANMICPRCNSDGSEKAIFPGGSQSLYCVNCNDQIPFTEVVERLKKDPAYKAKMGYGGAS